jgi:hypothetical protein
VTQEILDRHRAARQAILRRALEVRRQIALEGWWN